MSRIRVLLALWLLRGIYCGGLATIGGEIVGLIHYLTSLLIFIVALIIVIYPCCTPVLCLPILALLFVGLTRTMDRINRSE
jgi:hypothetical protein